MEREPCLISACLLGINCRYDGTHRALNPGLIAELIKTFYLIPVCPEQLGGLPTPRPPAQFFGGTGKELIHGRAKLVDEEGRETTSYILKAAEEVLKLTDLFGIKTAIFKDKSPACGVERVYMEGQIVSGEGVVTAVLRTKGLKILSGDSL